MLLCGENPLKKENDSESDLEVLEQGPWLSILISHAAENPKDLASHIVWLVRIS